MLHLEIQSESKGHVLITALDMLTVFVPNASVRGIHSNFNTLNIVHTQTHTNLLQIQTDKELALELAWVQEPCYAIFKENI